jgi:hypothetical protein
MDVTCDLLCWITMILACMLVGLKFLVILLDYWSYMGSGMRIWPLRWLFLYLCSYNLGCSVTNPVKPDYAMTSTWGSGACPSPEAPNLHQHFGLALCSCLANNANQGPDTRRQPSSYRGSGAPSVLPLGHDIAGHFPDKVTHGRDTKKTSPELLRLGDSPGAAPWAWHCWPLS